MPPNEFVVHAEFVMLIFTIVGLFFWLRTESREDHRLALNMIDSIHEEIKDFHARLCVLEERNKGK